MFKTLAFAIVLAAVVPLPAFAASAGVLALGPRVGFSVTPDQIVFGGQLQIGEVAPDLTFDPSLELGFGDNVTVISFNFDLHYHATIRDTDWRPYFGAGIGVNHFEVDLPPPFRDASDTKVTGAFVVGVAVPTGREKFFTELRVGFDEPDLKVVAGWNFLR